VPNAGINHLVDGVNEKVLLAGYLFSGYAGYQEVASVKKNYTCSWEF